MCDDKIINVNHTTGSISRYAFSRQVIRMYGNITKRVYSTRIYSGKEYIVCWGRIAGMKDNTILTIAPEQSVAMKLQQK